METIKNFAVGLLITALLFLFFVLGFFLWPVMLGIGSLLLFVGIIVVAIVLVFYVIAFIGYVVRKALKRG